MDLLQKPKTIKGKKQYFLLIFHKAQKKFARSSKRLAAEGWSKDWQVLIATIMSAQSRDETTISIAEDLFKHFSTLKSLAEAEYTDVLKILKHMNYNKTKAKHIIQAAQKILGEYHGSVPQTEKDLLRIPGVGRKTANLILSECFSKPTITVDTHVHRISNVLNLVKTKNHLKTEQELQKIAPQIYWSKINRIFVLWGKEVQGRNKEKLLKALDFP
jgi:endonuclease-3